ncbi:Ankyrin repeat domain-containing protein 50 [Penicillium subrubescens]|uniref:Ankyrin repeat domain-containing protein 50 n=1 Tax=Penicillium subrubescens TaxID=1316194 RepID=A0A1Q5UBQ3_9EURO|nr:Ankyrin repeat domain-containing protein 50 [Penicillium subrubescens]
MTAHNAVMKTDEYDFYQQSLNYSMKQNALNQKSSALLWAAERGIEATAVISISNGSHIEITDIHGRTPLFWAAYNGHEAVVKILLDTESVDADIKDSKGETPLLAAAQHGHAAVVKLLLETRRVDVNSKVGYETPLFRAAWEGREAVVKLLLETELVDLHSKDDPNGWTPLYVAAWHGHELVVKLFLATGCVDADSKDSNLYLGRPRQWRVDARSGSGADQP